MSAVFVPHFYHGPPNIFRQLGVLLYIPPIYDHISFLIDVQAARSQIK
jgi:hypothetical protein